MPYTGLSSSPYLHPNQPGVDIRTWPTRKIVLKKPSPSVHEFPISPTGRSLSETIAPLMIPSSSPTRRELLNTAINHMMLPHSRKPSPLSSSPNKPSPLQLCLDDQQKSVSGVMYSASHMSYREVETVEAPPVMLRKKSGEIVRPVLKPKTSKSEPTTPTCSKTVHFDINLEQIRLFLRAETPAAVIGDRTDDDDDDDDNDDTDFHHGELTCSLPNWPPAKFGMLKPVHVEPVSVSQDEASLIGRVQVQNIAYHKRVVVRYTFDDWKTVGEVQATYYESLSKNMGATTYDVFSFSISLVGKVGGGMAPEDEHTDMCFAVKYSVDGRDIWDNNNGSNYFVAFKRKPASKSVSAEASAEWTMDDVDQETYPSRVSSSYSSSPEINPAMKSKTFSRYDFPSSITTTATKKSVPVPSPPAQVRPAHHARVKSSPAYIGSHPAAPAFSTGPTVDGYPASLYPDSYGSSSIEQPMVTARNAIPIAITVPAAKSSTLEKSNPKETSLRMFSSSPVSGGSRPSPNSSSYFDFVSKYCFYDSNANPYSTSPYSNSPPAQLIRG